jgi:hypothetical protein
MLNNSNPGLSGQTVTLSGEDLNGNPVHVTTTTDANGAYSFTGLYAGDYAVWYDTYPLVYTPDSVQVGTAWWDTSTVQQIGAIMLLPNSNSTDNNFWLIDMVWAIAGTIYRDM